MEIEKVTIRCTCCGETLEGMEARHLWSDDECVLISVHPSLDQPPLILRINFKSIPSAVLAKEL